MTNEKMQLPVRLIATIAAISFLSGGIGGAIFTRVETTKVIEERNFVESSDSINAIEKVVPSVISIVATKDLQIFQQQPLNPFMNDPFFRQFMLPNVQPNEQKPDQPQTKRQEVAGGTGFIVDETGLALTNKHVVSVDGADYTALTKDGKKYDVEIISRDPVNDVAVIQLHEQNTDEDTSNRKTGEKKEFGPKPSGMTPAELGDSGLLKVGQRVLAIGNARGEYNNSVTAGIISAIGRDIQASDNGGGQRETLTGLIQTDAAINFGNSGGPLINEGGEVIGINTAVDTSANGVGFAIPMTQIKPALESVAKFGYIVRPVLGVNHTVITKENAKDLNIKDVDYGALVVGDRTKKEFGVVPGSPAEKAGLKLDDIILELDGEKITSNNTLQSMVQKHQPGDTIKLKVWRDGKTFEVSVKLDERKE
ncbi:trypsin-like peptidase domain-containing protein [Candidatus Gracilibacteria bacterium]|nr:trypsin-like peptidase domain-containing protein [Candidatus Gracilibacteria bacterium]